MSVRVLLFAIVFSVFASCLAAQDRPGAERQFRIWLNQEIWPRAKARGVSRKTFDTAVAGVSLQWDLPDLVPFGENRQGPRKQRQAEFGAPARYFNPGSVNAATRIGKQMSRQLRDTLAGAERRYGVPGRILLAIWGRESGYGRVRIPHDAFRVLSTKGFMSTRRAYFTDELVAALQIAQSGQAPGGTLKSSWAGALGQPQFMPSSFLKYAVDGNGDNRIDIWRSQADTLASIGNYLAQHGWDSRRDWGFEVNVPDKIPCTREGPDNRKTIDQWVQMGITRVSGRAFPAHERGGQASLLMPAGRLGPAFLVSPNFYALKDYNNSDLYALFVGHVGDRIAFGSGDFRANWQQIDPMLRSDIAMAQRKLEAMGKDVGGADGLPGFKTRRSIGAWQAANGLAPTCFPDLSVIAALTR